MTQTELQPLGGGEPPDVGAPDEAVRREHDRGHVGREWRARRAASVGGEPSARVRRAAQPLVLLAAALWLAFAVYVATVPSALEYVSAPEGEIANSGLSAAIAVAFAAAILLTALVSPERGRRIAPWGVALAVVALLWEYFTAKSGILHPPYWPAPQTQLRLLIEERAILLESLWATVKLLAVGFGLGGTVGFFLGLSMGWSQRVHYWASPLLKTIGPVPAVALIPATFAILPTAYAASVLLLAYSAAFPIAVLTFSGIAGVPRAYYDVAVTLGAKPRFLVWRVAVPAALPSVFVGLFMSLGAVFPTLVVSEQLGAKAGLGWYLQWQQQWAAYPKMYVVIFVMTLLFSGLIALVFRARNKFLSWQKGLVRW